MKTLSDFYRLFPSHPAMIVRKAEATSPNTARAPLPASPPANDDAHHATVEIGRAHV